MRNMICEPIWFQIRKNESIGMTLSRKWDRENEILAYIITCLLNMKVEHVPRCPLMRNICPSMSLDAKHDMWTYLVWNSVKWKYWNDPCRENEMLAYVDRSLINSELVPWCETWYVNLFGFKFGKMKVLEWLCRENEILAYFSLYG